jgi:inosine-uridine nucleoside N-ribohydrolase
MRRAHAELSRILALAGGSTDARVHFGAGQYLPSVDQPAESEGAHFLIEAAHEDRDSPLYVVAIGCATNVASALLLDPSLVERIVVVWTAAYPSFWPGANTSYNLAQDVPAARVLLESGVPLVFLPGYYVGEELRVSRAEIAAHVAGRGVLGQYLHSLYEGHPRGGHTLGQSKVLWDLINIAWLLEPAWFSVHSVPTPSLGDDLRWISHGSDRHAMLEAVDVDRDEIFADFYRCLEAHAAQ